MGRRGIFGTAVEWVLRLMASMWTHPIEWAVGIFLWVMWRDLGTNGMVWLTIGAVAVCWFVWVVSPETFRVWIGRPLVGWWRSWVRYRSRWRRVMVMTGLAPRFEHIQQIPRLVSVISTPYADQLLVHLVEGQEPSDYEQRAMRLAHAFRARGCRVTVPEPGWVWLELLPLRDRLCETIPAMPIPDGIFLENVPVGVTEDGPVWWLRLLGTHVLVAGVTGAGKGSVLWSLLRGVCPAIRDGVVRVWALDPKGGMELGIGRKLFSRFATDLQAMVTLLEDAVELMQERAARLAGVTRQHVPTAKDPLILVLVDELAALVTYADDAELRGRAKAALSILLTQGRAVGVNVVAALQDPRKEVVPFRNLFPVKVGLRLDEPTQVDMVLGAGARKRGALCDDIPEGTPGVAFVRMDGVRAPIRARAGYVTDEDIVEMSAAYPAPPDIPRYRQGDDGPLDVPF